MYEKLERLRAAKGVSCYEISKATGIGQSVFSDWKHGRYEPKYEKLKRIADYFGVPVEYFYGGEQ